MLVENRATLFKLKNWNMKNRSTTSAPSDGPGSGATTTASTALVNRDLNEMMVEQVMGMDPHSLADALVKTSSINQIHSISPITFILNCPRENYCEWVKLLFFLKIADGPDDDDDGGDDRIVRRLHRHRHARAQRRKRSRSQSNCRIIEFQRFGSL